MKKLTGFGLVLFTILLFVILVWYKVKKEDKIERWASQNGFEIVKIEETFFDYGPFDKQHGETVYRVKMKDKQNREIISWFKVSKNLIDQKWENHE